MTNGEPTKAPAPRIGHKERDDAVERLRTAAGDGRITLDELETRVEAALEARTADDIEVLIADLPDLPDLNGSGPLVTARPVQPARLAASHSVVNRLGDWRVPEEISIELRHGNSVLDLRTPSLPPQGVTIAVNARHSSIKVLVSENAAVDLTGVVCHHGQAKDRAAGRVTAASGPPIVFTGDLNHSVLKILRSRQGLLSRGSSSPRRELSA